MDTSYVREFCREYNSRSVEILALLLLVALLPLLIIFLTIRGNSEWQIYLFAFWGVLYVWQGPRWWGILGMRWNFYQWSKSACTGNIEALSLLAHWSEYGLNGLPASYDTARLFQLYIASETGSTSLIDFYRRNAQQGKADAQFELGQYYQSAEPEEAVNWYRKAAEQGYPDAKYKLGQCCELGLGIEKNPAKAIMWYREAAKYSRFAPYALGRCYEKGIGVEVNFAEAIEWYQKAAEYDPDAQYALGRCYEKGIGVGINYAEAVEWYRKAAKWTDAQYALGRCYEKGIGVEINYTEAIEWYRKAAKYSLDAQQALGRLYGTGIEAETNYSETVE